MMKKNYQKPEVEYIQFTSLESIADVIDGDLGVGEFSGEFIE